MSNTNMRKLTKLVQIQKPFISIETDEIANRDI